jgi:hypothetical protein
MGFQYQFTRGEGRMESSFEDPGIGKGRGAEPVKHTAVVKF